MYLRGTNVSFYCCFIVQSYDSLNIWRRWRNTFSERTLPPHAPTWVPKRYVKFREATPPPLQLGTFWISSYVILSGLRLFHAYLCRYMYVRDDVTNRTKLWVNNIIYRPHQSWVDSLAVAGEGSRSFRSEKEGLDCVLIFRPVMMVLDTR